MMDNTGFMRESIMRDMSEGILCIGQNGVIEYVNPAAAKILCRDAQTLLGEKFVRCFFGEEENDAFNQAILDAAYERNSTHRNIVPYFTGKETRQVQITTSYLHREGERVGLIAVLSDISELEELRDAVKAMDRIKGLNRRLELRNKLLSETFGRFLSDDIVRELLDTPGGLSLGGRKLCITVMMSDLRGFTAMSESMDARELITMLNHYLGEMTGIIQKHNGTIIEFLGDGILAIYGAPVRSSGHAADAVAAAVEMQLRMEDINRWNRRQGFPELEMGIGINTGEVIVGNIGSEKRSKYGVVGSQVNLCGRIESYTVGGQILVSPETRAMVDEPLETDGELRVQPKGVKETLLLSSVTGIGGKYGLCYERRRDSLYSLPKALETKIFLLSGKHVEEKPEKAMISALSRTEAIIECKKELSLFDNLQLDCGGRLFAKITEKTERGWRLRFTSVPPEFEDWYEKALKAENSISL